MHWKSSEIKGYHSSQHPARFPKENQPPQAGSVATSSFGLPVVAEKLWDFCLFSFCERENEYLHFPLFHAGR